MSYRSIRAGRVAAAAGLFTAVIGGTGTALAAAPTFETIPIEDQFTDEFLTEICGVDVTTTATGQIKIRTFEDGTGIQSVLSINVRLTARADGNVYKFQDVGADVVTVRPDGTVVELSTGQVPFGFTGALMVNMATGEVILEPTHNTEGDLDEACDALTA